MPFPSAYFTIFLDAPLINRLHFDGTQSLSVLSSGVTTDLGTYDFDEIIRVSLLADPVLGDWSVSIDGEILHTGPLTSNGDIAFLRFNGFFGNTDQQLGTVAIDSILVTTLPAIPEPGTAQLLGIGLCALIAYQRTIGRLTSG